MEGKKVKEKTRDLAHSRRKKENDTFTDIAQSLPIQENAKDLDKASILRVAIHYLKLRDMIREGGDEAELTEEQLQNVLNGGATLGPLGELLPPTEQQLQQAFASAAAGQAQPTGVGSPSSSSQTSESSSTPSEPSLSDILPNFSKDVLQALDGFMMVVSRDGRILYVSESIANYLGLRQVDVIGVHVQELIHPQDCSEVAAIFQTQGHDIEQIFDAKDPLRRKFVVRMRCAFTPSVRSITRCSNFKPIYCSCFLRFARSGPHVGQFTGIVALCKLASIPKLKEMAVGTFFKTKHALDLSYTAIDTRIRWILGYDPSEMVGLKAYQYFHPEDLTSTSSCHMNLLSRGHSHSPCYRFLSHWGDWIWVRSKSHVIFNTRSQLPEAVVIYTWIVRIEEEDDRMKAIKAGEKGEDKVKKYDPFDSEVSSANGKLDISALANPTAPAGAGLNEPPAPIKTIKKESASPPPVDVATSPKDLVTPPSSILGDVKLYQGSPSADILSPQSDTSDCPPNVNPFSNSPTSSLSSGDGINHYQSPPERRTSYTHGSPAEVVDQTSVYSQHQLQHQSFMPSPPYTPYNNSPAAAPGGDVHQFPTSTVGYDSNGSPYSLSYSTTPTSNGVHPLPPLSGYKGRRSLSPSECSSDGTPYSSTSPPFSATSMSQSLPMVGGGVGVAAPPTLQPGEPVAYGYIAPNFHPATTPPHVAMSVGTPSPSAEMPSTFYTHGSAVTYQPNVFGDMVPVGGATLGEVQFVSNGQVVGSNFTSRSVPQPRSRQTVINDARTRYSGVMPSAGHYVHGSAVRGHAGSGDRETDSITQWSQWLQNGAPAGPPPPVY